MFLYENELPPRVGIKIVFAYCYRQGEIIVVVKVKLSKVREERHQKESFVFTDAEGRWKKVEALK